MKKAEGSSSEVGFEMRNGEQWTCRRTVCRSCRDVHGYISLRCDGVTVDTTSRLVCSLRLKANLVFSLLCAIVYYLRYSGIFGSVCLSVCMSVCLSVCLSVCIGAETEKLLMRD